MVARHFLEARIYLSSRQPQNHRQLPTWSGLGHVSREHPSNRNLTREPPSAEIIENGRSGRVWAMSRGRCPISKIYRGSCLASKSLKIVDLVEPGPCLAGVLLKPDSSPAAARHRNHRKLTIWLNLRHVSREHPSNRNLTREPPSPEIIENGRPGRVWAMSRGRCPISQNLHWQAPGFEIIQNRRSCWVWVMSRGSTAQPGF